MVQQRDAIKWVSAVVVLKDSSSQIIRWNYGLKEEITGSPVNPRELNTSVLS